MSGNAPTGPTSIANVERKPSITAEALGNFSPQIICSGPQNAFTPYRIHAMFASEREVEDG